MWDPFENPMVVRYIRTKLQRDSPVPGIVMMQVACLLILVIGGMFVRAEKGQAAYAPLFYLLLCLVAAVLVLFGAGRVSLAVLSDRSTGVLESYRLTPTPARGYLAGYLLGAPVRETLAAVSAVPYIAYAGARGGIRLSDGLICAGLLIVTSILFSLGGVVAGLSVPGIRLPQARGQGVAAGGLAILFLVLPACGAILDMTSSGKSPFDAVLPFYGIDAPVPALILLLEGFLGSFAGIAGCRKLARDDAPPLSKRQTAAFYLLLHLLMLGFAWDWLSGTPGAAGFRRMTGAPSEAVGAAWIVLALAALFVGNWSVSLSVPSRLAWLRERQRIAKGISRGSPAAEGAGHLLWGLSFGAVTAAAYAAVLALRTRAVMSLPAELVSHVLAALLPASVLLAFGASLEYFFLRLRSKSAIAFQSMIVALHWVVPVALGLGLALGARQVVPACWISALSPLGSGLWTGHLLFEGFRKPEIPDPRGLVALGIAVNLALTIVFHRLLAGVRRRLAAEVLNRAADPASGGTPGARPAKTD